MQIIGIILILVVIGLYAFWIWYTKNQQGVSAKTEGEAQVFDIIVKGVYTPNLIKAKLGKPIKINFKRELKHLYSPPKGKFTIVDVPAMNFFMIDGYGYPEGLAGEDIPFIGRILALSDSWDAMANDRFYRRARSIDEIIEELLEGIDLSGKKEE